MDCLDYGSGSESDSEQASGEIQETPQVLFQGPVVTIPAPSVPICSLPDVQPVETAIPKQKKKKLDISLLPQEIQDALIRGYDNDDSDEEEGYSSKRAKYDTEGSSSSSSQKVSYTGAVEADPLLALLPAPKNSSQAAAPVPSVSSGKTSKGSATFAMIPPSVAKKANPPASSSSSVPPPLPTSTNVTPSSFPPLPSFADIPSPYSAPPSYPSYSAGRANIPVSSSDSSGPEMSSRRKQRELEHQLMHGITDGMSSKLTTIQAPSLSEWDSSSYTEQQSLEKQVRSNYASVSNVSRVDNKKNQITSLLSQAADSELKLLNLKASKMKTKAESNRKYGW